MFKPNCLTHVLVRPFDKSRTPNTQVRIPHRLWDEMGWATLLAMHVQTALVQASIGWWARQTTITLGQMIKMWLVEDGTCFLLLAYGFCHKEFAIKDFNGLWTMLRCLPPMDFDFTFEVGTLSQLGRWLSWLWAFVLWPIDLLDFPTWSAPLCMFALFRTL